MNKQLFTNNGHAKFPISTETFTFIQEQIFLTARLATLAGQNVILVNSTSTTDGLIVVEGELLPLKGSVKQYIQVIEEKETITAMTEVFEDVRITRYVQYSDSGILASTFTVVPTIAALLAQVTAIEKNYITSQTVQFIVEQLNQSLKNHADSINGLSKSVTTIENNYNTKQEITDLLNQNAQHHLPKGAIIDWYGTADFDHIPYGFVPCGAFFSGSASQFAPDGAGTKEIAKWKARYSSITITSVGLADSAVGILISSCNGQVVPNLTDRFIVQAGGKYNLGATGGVNDVTLTVQQMPSHNHSGVTNDNVADGAHSHELNLYLGEYKANSTYPYSYNSTNGNGTRLATANNSGTHKHNISSQGGSQAHENRPPYYALYKLIKVI